MYEMSEAHQNALNKAQGYFQYGSTNPLLVKHRQNTIENYGFADGSIEYQWSNEALKILRQRGQEPIVANKLRAMVNQVCGLEVNTRTKFAFRSHQTRDDSENLPKALTHLGFYFQENQDFSFKSSLRFRNVLIAGIGWVRMWVHNGKFYYDVVDPLDIIPDMDDFSPQFTNMRFVASMRFYSRDELKIYWPKFSRRFDDIILDTISSGYPTAGGGQEYYYRRTAEITSTYTDSGTGTRAPVVEVQYKRPKKFFSAFDKNGYSFATFDEDKANDLADSKKDIVEEWGTEMMRTVYIQDILLEHGPLQPHIPNMQDFSYIPQIWDKSFDDRIPRSWITDLKTIQREINYSKTKYLNALNSVRAIVDPNAFEGMSHEQIREELRRPDSIIYRTIPNSVDIIPNIDMAASHLKSSERSDYELQQISGMFSDSLGEPTNATSGVAIKQRQIGTSKNLASGFDSSTFVKKREGRKMLDLVQGGDFENLDVQILDQDEQETITLNLTRRINGKEVIFNDIRTIPLDVYIENVPDYDSSPEEQQATLEALLANPSAPLILQNPQLLKLLRFRDGEKIAAAMQQLQNQQAQLENGAQPQPMPMGGNIGAVDPTNLGQLTNG